MHLLDVHPSVCYSVPVWVGLQENHGITITVNTMILAIAMIWHHGCDFRRIIYRISTVEHLLALL